MASNRNNADSMHPAISWQGRVVNRVMGRAIKPVISRLRFTRRFMKFSQLGFDALTLALPVPANVHIARTHMGGVPCEWLIAGREVRSNRVVVYFHGGAYFFGSPRSHRAVTWRLSRHCRAKVLALDYRQPPDWCYPAPLEDAVRAYQGLLKQGYRSRDIVFAGDSAGGNLALVTLLRLRELSLPMPACAVLISPWADLTCSGESHWRHVRHDPFIPMKALRFVSASYSEGYNPASPMLSPAFADLTGLPPLMIQVGSTEVLYSDAVRVAEQARKAGVPCQLQVWEDMMHVFHALAAWLPEASLALREIGSFVNEILREEDEAGHLRARTRVVSRRA
ncbi:alpha/beta hydrolase [Alcanivorax hongdengensis A-11-3]|uniref:Alpha/beta hydrolase n=1 Tax=Alcanivorax hongdengensis A-11-3 TaxID=1177179 RepID=L0WDQ9_9GAMM|nr:alpha/beta hydrolase [Alcanivorax hongdengensis]EKF75181.1 alpha/beta hydrolase [Alcanivorax hongdengensis A-11-3]